MTRQTKPPEKTEICILCTEKYCCRGICREMNNFLINKKREKTDRKDRK